MELPSTPLIDVSRDSLYECIVNSTEDAIISKDLNGHIITWNRAAEQIFGYQASEILAQPISILIPAHLRGEEQKLIERIKSNQVVEHYETERLRKDGSVIQVSLTLSPIKDQQGRIIGASKILQDITKRIKANKALIDSEFNYRSLFHSNPLPIFILEIGSLQFLDINETAIQHYGYSREEFLAMTAFDIRPETEREKIKLVPSPKANETLNLGLFKHLKKDGTELLVEIRTHDIHYNGKAARMVLCYDVTEKTAADEKIASLNKTIADSELKFRSIIENNKDIIILMNAKMEVVYRSPSAVKITGHTLEEIEEIVSKAGAISQLHPDDLPNTIAALQKVIETQGIPIPVHFRSRHKDGHYVWLEGTITNYLEDPKIQSIVQNLQDITAKKAVELQLQRSEKTYRTIASSIPGAVIFLFDLAYKYILIEGALLKKFGYERDQLIGKTIFEVLDPVRVAELVPFFERVYTGEQFSVDDERGTENTSTRYVPLKDENGTIYGAMVVLIDVTELKNTQKELSDLNLQLENKIAERTVQLSAAIKELEAFSYSVSHDLRAPLRGIDGWSLALLEDYGDRLDSKAHEYLGRVRAETQRMGILIDDMLKLSRISKTELNLTQINLSNIANTICNRLLEEYTGRNIELKIATSLYAFADASLVEIMLTNLFGNAFKFTGRIEKAIIEFGSHQIDDYTVYYIKDNGTGFNMQNAKNLFGAFQRMHRQTDFPGSGIGLAIVQRIINLHKGRIWAESQVNEGSIFHFIINPHTDGK